MAQKSPSTFTGSSQPSHAQPGGGQSAIKDPTEQAMQLFRQIARERPEAVALWALGIGFLLGWKLKPW